MRRMIVAACGVVMLTATAGAQNLLQSPGFEELDGERPKGWVLSGGSEVIVDLDLAHSGRRCVKARFEESVSQQLAIEDGAAYRITGWIRRVQPGGTETPKIKVYFLDAKGGRADVQATEFEQVTAGRWHRWETVVQAPLNAKTMNLTLRAFFGGSEWFYYDDLTVERVEAISWPARDATPNLHGLTVAVPDVADVWTEALLRIPPAALVPVDGRLDSSVLVRGQDIRVRLQRPTRVCWALVHSMRPEMNLGRARLVSVEATTGTGERRLLAASKSKEELVTSLRFKPTAVSEFVLEVPGNAAIRINEMQLLGLSEDGTLPGDRVEMILAQADPPKPIAKDLAAAFAAAEHRASVIATTGTVRNADAPNKLGLPAEKYLNVFATPRKDEYGLAGFSLDLVLPGAGEGDMIEVTFHRPEELDVDIRWTTYTDRGIRPRTKRRNFATVVRAVSRVKGGRLSVTFDVPDLVYQPVEKA